MLAIARRSLGIPVIQGRAENLPVADASMDFVTMGYALRHVEDLAATFREFRRVLRPGGRVLILEISRPVSAPARTLAQLYFRQLVPAVCRLLSAGEEARDLMRYYWDTIEACVPPPVILAALAGAGFESRFLRHRAWPLSRLRGAKAGRGRIPADGAVSPVPDGRYCLGIALEQPRPRTGGDLVPCHVVMGARDLNRRVGPTSMSMSLCSPATLTYLHAPFRVMSVWLPVNRIGWVAHGICCVTCESE